MFRTVELSSPNGALGLLALLAHNGRAALEATHRPRGRRVERHCPRTAGGRVGDHHFKVPVTIQVSHAQKVDHACINGQTVPREMRLSAQRTSVRSTADGTGLAKFFDSEHFSGAVAIEIAVQRTIRPAYATNRDTGRLVVTDNSHGDAAATSRAATERSDPRAIWLGIRTRPAAPGEVGLPNEPAGVSGPAVHLGDDLAVGLPFEPQNVEPLRLLRRRSTWLLRRGGERDSLTPKANACDTPQSQA